MVKLATLSRGISQLLLLAMWVGALVLIVSETLRLTGLLIAAMALLVLPFLLNLIMIAVLSPTGGNTYVGEAFSVAKLNFAGIVPGLAYLTVAKPSHAMWTAGLVTLLFLHVFYLGRRFRQRNAASMQLAAACASGTQPTRAGGRSCELQFPAERARHTFAELAGMEDLKAKLQAAATEVLAGAKATKTIDLRANIRNGILLFGDPGNGKTVIAEGLAGTLGLPIISVSFGSVASKWVNSTTENVVALFRDARAQAPCILFLDEVDSVIRDREQSSGGENETAKTTNQILTELVAIRGTGVVVVMATNIIDQLDPAAIREGRVDFKLLVPPPDAEARRAIINNAIARSLTTVNCKDEAVTQAVKRWEGFSAARIHATVSEAARAAASSGQTVLTYDYLQEALRKMQGALGDQISEDTPCLDDLHLPPSQKIALTGIARRMIDIELIESLGGTVPTGLLFAGPPGTGKTLAVRALAKTTRWPLLTFSGADLVSNSEAIDNLCQKARNARPCIVFIDEADDVFADRRRGNNFIASITNKLLTAIDGVGGKPYDILWVAAVNTPEVMDAAAMRGGRFTEKIWFGDLDEITATAIIEQWLVRSPAKFEAGLSAHALADLLNGESPANIHATLQLAVNLMIARSLDQEATRLVKPCDIQAARSAIRLQS